jgi:hypothetical protein
MGYQEHISGRRGRLTEHVATSFSRDYEPSWTAAFVSGYARANGVELKSQWFDCRNLTWLLDNGSNASIATSKVDAAMLDGRTRMKPFN